MNKKNYASNLMAVLSIVAFGISFLSCTKSPLVLDEKAKLSVHKLAVSTVPADAMTFVIPANKAYAEPFEQNDNAVGVSIPVGYPEDFGVVSNWTSQARSVVYYLYQTAAQLLTIKNSLPEK